MFDLCFQEKIPWDISSSTWESLQDFVLTCDAIDDTSESALVSYLRILPTVS